MAAGDRGIYLSPKYGVNPSLGVCFYCGEEDGTVVLPGRLLGDEQAPHRAVWSMEPCPKCKDLMVQGVIFISVREGSDPKNPYRTGGFAVVKDEAVRRMVQPEAHAEEILRKRAAFLPDAVWNALGLPAIETLPAKEAAG